MSVLMEIANELGRDVEDDIRIKFLFHCSCMIERTVVISCLIMIWKFKKLC